MVNAATHFQKMSILLEETNQFNSSTSYSTFYLLLTLVTILWFLHRWQQQTIFFKMGNKIPGPNTLPFLGNAHMALFKEPSAIMKLALDESEKFSDICRIWIGNKLMIFLTKPEDVEVILSSHAHIKKSEEYRFFEPWLGEGLLISTGSKWRAHRRILAPTFHINILKSFIGIFNKNSKDFVEKMRPEIGKVFDVYKHLGTVTFDILLETTMGMSKGTQGKSGFHYTLAVLNMCNIIHQRQYKIWLRIDSLFKLSSLYKQQLKMLGVIHGLANEVIKARKDIYDENKTKGKTITPPTTEELTHTNNDDEDTADKEPFSDVFQGYKDDLDFNDENDVGEKKRLPFLDMLIDSAQNKTNHITESLVKDQVATFMFEGHDTTTSSSSFVLSMLGVHQHIQDKVYNELYEIFGDSDRPVTFTDTLRMKYLERVILETLRLYPPVPVIARKLEENVKIVTKNYVLPAGSTVVIATFKIHRSPKHYKNPEEFNPDNFLPENTQKRHYYSYIPFSAGPRSCVGRKYAMLKLKILLATILRNYKTISAVSEKEFTLQGDIILKRTDGFRIRIEPRNRIPSTSTAA